MDGHPQDGRWIPSGWMNKQSWHGCAYRALAGGGTAITPRKAPGGAVRYCPKAAAARETPNAAEQGTQMEWQCQTRSNGVSRQRKHAPAKPVRTRCARRSTNLQSQSRVQKMDAPVLGTQTPRNSQRPGKGRRLGHTPARDRSWEQMPPFYGLFLALGHYDRGLVRPKYATRWRDLPRQTVCAIDVRDGRIQSGTNLRADGVASSQSPGHQAGTPAGPAALWTAAVRPAVSLPLPTGAMRSRQVCRAKHPRVIAAQFAHGIKGTGRCVATSGRRTCRTAGCAARPRCAAPRRGSRHAERATVRRADAAAGCCPR